MSDITRLSVLEAFLKYDTLSFQEFYEKKIFKNIDSGSIRLKELGTIIQDLDNIGILKRMPPPIAWKIEDYAKANKEHLRLMEEKMPLTTSELKNRILTILITTQDCTKQSVATLLNISVQRARGLLEEIFNEDKCKRLRGYGDAEFNYAKNEDTEAFINSGGYEKEQVNYHAKNVTHIHNSQIGNISSGNVKGNLYQESLQAANSISQPIKQPTAPHTNITKRIWVWVMNNPMSATIIGGIVAMIVATLILKYYHVIH